jgi:hypothetical protein
MYFSNDYNLIDNLVGWNFDEQIKKIDKEYRKKRNEDIGAC